MSTSIYNISPWVASTPYSVHDIVSVNGRYYYCSAAHTSQSDFGSDLGLGKWNGYIVSNGKNKPYFTWKPNYNSAVDNQPNVKVVRFGDGYEQRTPNGINNLLLMFDYSFEARSNSEATAILHFLSTRAGHESFFFLPPAPYDSLKLFVCRTWQHTFIFYDNQSIRAKFEEVPA